jgi:hypothetical protein
VTRRLAIAAVAAVALPLLAADAAMACSCVPLNEREQLRKSDGAFIGRLVAIREVDPPAEGELIGSGDPIDYVYRVGQVFNRGPGLRRVRRVRVRSARSGASCGLETKRGDLEALFVNRSGGRWRGNLCLTTTPRKMRRAANGEAAGSGGGCR